MNKPTKKSLAKYIRRSVQALYYMEKTNPEQYKVLWIGWLEICKDIEDMKDKEAKND